MLFKAGLLHSEFLWGLLPLMLLIDLAAAFSPVARRGCPSLQIAAKAVGGREFGGKLQKGAHETVLHKVFSPKMEDAFIPQAFKSSLRVLWCGEQRNSIPLLTFTVPGCITAKILNVLIAL